MQIIDLVGDLPLPDGPALQRLDLDAWGEALWQQLVPVLQPWAELLALDPQDQARPCVGEIPGLDAVLRVLYLAEHWQSAAEPGATVVVVLPPPAQAVTALQLACRGPGLLAGLWHPLLLWWGETRQRLAQFEMLLRLRLPTAESLELSPRWRSALQALSDRLMDPLASTEVLLALAVEPEQLDGLGGRLVALPLCGLPWLRLWLEADLPQGTADQLAKRFQLPLVVTRPGEDLAPQAHDWLNQPLIAAPHQWIRRKDSLLCRLYLPGLQRPGLQVRQVDQQLQILSAGLRLEVSMPQQSAQLTCRSARVVSPWLEVVLS